MNILDHLQEHPPRYGPEWGSGGIFGLKYYNGILYYTLAFEAESYFISRDGVRKIYRFDRIGPHPRSGGDTYNAVEVVDDKIYFGGWVHAPAKYRGKENGYPTIDFTNKYSHVHYYDIGENLVELLWKESMHDPEKWVGEVSEIIYDPYEQKLLLARADGYENLGVYSLDPRSGAFEKILEEPALKGSIVTDQACFAIHSYPHGLSGVECIDLIDKKKYVEHFAPNLSAVDGDAIVDPQVGSTASLYGRLFIFHRGGVSIGDISEKEYWRIRLFDIPGSYLAPLRCNAKVFGGGVLVAYNMFVHGITYIRSSEESIAKKKLNTIVSPSILLYITPPTIRVVGVFGARITSIETIGDKILLATNNMANTGRYDASPFDQGIRSFTIIDHNQLFDKPPSYTITIPGWMVGEKTFGGIPLNGYRDPRIILYLRKNNKLLINEYGFTIPPVHLGRDHVDLTSGKNIVSLNNYTNIVSFKLDRPLLDDEYIVLELR